MGKRVVIINGGPRKNGNTSQLLERARIGALSAKAKSQVETYNLYDYRYHGCVSCYACKLKDNPATFCAVNDDLKPVLASIQSCDVLVLGSPIYWFEVTGQMRCFLERLLYPCISYDNQPGPNDQSRFPRRIEVALFFTMGVSEEIAKSAGFFDTFDRYKKLLEQQLGHTQIQTSCFTYQFADYSKYAASIFDEPTVREHRDTVFAKELDQAEKLLSSICDVDDIEVRQ